MLLETAFLCLALNTYHEAKNQSMVGQIAVAEVVMNRVADSRYPNTIFEVVKQGPKYKGSDVPVRHRCKFSWYCDGKSDIPKNEKAWKKAQDYAYLVLYNRIAIDVTEGATDYHATYVKPSWAKTKKRTTRIDKHIFYRWEK